MRVARTGLLTALVAVAVVAVVLWLAGQVHDGPGEAVSHANPGSAEPTAAVPSGAASSGAGCDVPSRGVVPHQIAVPGLVDRRRVLAPPRDDRGVPGVPPLTERGKSLFAWDREQGVRPGDRAGNVLLNAHTWPDGSALGNTLLSGLHRGDRIVVLGEGRRLCYRVTERVEVLAEDGLARYYDADGPPQLAIVVCSGRRLAPGVWEKRTVWFASPVGPG